MKIIRDAKEKVAQYFGPVEEIALANQEKVLKAFHGARVGSHCFTDSTGYAYSDLGRETLEEVYARLLRAEAALVRPQIVSGTHAISICLSILEPGEELLSASGTPYDTLQAVIGVRGDSPRSLIKRGIVYKEVPLQEDFSLDLAGISAAVTTKTKIVMLQRSRGYSWRPALRISDLAEAVRTIREKNSQCIIFVDNCYGEFVEYFEPLEVGVDLIAGSLIKNPGGTLAASG
ncbi:MAG TPA: methionine gamma-lyase family protein, partial [Limnochordia bacterium]|nr:methionine gamma-lyase family protein [Limnochordia bacterium]